MLSFISQALAAIVNSMPTAIIGGVSFILYGMISAIGVRNVVENKVDFTNSRNLIIAAVILVCGLGFSSGITFTIGAAPSITLTGLAIAAIAGHRCSTPSSPATTTSSASIPRATRTAVSISELRLIIKFN